MGEHALPGGDLQHENDDDGQHGNAAIPGLGRFGPPPLPHEDWRGQHAALTVVGLQQGLHVTCTLIEGG